MFTEERCLVALPNASRAPSVGLRDQSIQGFMITAISERDARELSHRLHSSSRPLTGATKDNIDMPLGLSYRQEALLKRYDYD
jgi:hypothetical protein